MKVVSHFFVSACVAELYNRYGQSLWFVLIAPMRNRERERERERVREGVGVKEEVKK